MSNIHRYGTEAYSYKQNFFKKALLISSFKVLEWYEKA